jgi:hypothetical protein
MSHDWIWGYLKGAKTRNPPASAEAWSAVEAALGEAPEEVRALYSESDGATLNGGLVLYPLRGQPSVLESSRSAAPAWVGRQAWRLGEQGLFAARRGDLEPPPGRSDSPPWLGKLPKDAWVFLRAEAKERPRFYKTLDALLASLVPPTDAEEFGEATYTRALSSVEKAVAAIHKNVPRRTVSKKAPGKR